MAERLKIGSVTYSFIDFIHFQLINSTIQSRDTQDFQDLQYFDLIECDQVVRYRRKKIKDKQASEHVPLGDFFPITNFFTFCVIVTSVEANTNVNDKEDVDREVDDLVPEQICKLLINSHFNWHCKRIEDGQNQDEVVPPSLVLI